MHPSPTGKAPTRAGRRGDLTAPRPRWDAPVCTGAARLVGSAPLLHRRPLRLHRPLPPPPIHSRLHLHPISSSIYQEMSSLRGGHKPSGAGGPGNGYDGQPRLPAGEPGPSHRELGAVAGNPKGRAQASPAWQGPVQHAAVREAAVSGSLGGAVMGTGGCTGCLTAPRQALHSWARGVEAPAACHTSRQRPFHAQRFCRDRLPPHASPL